MSVSASNHARKSISVNFAYNDTLPYPFADEIFPDEDGVGYALRMAQAYIQWSSQR